MNKAERHVALICDDAYAMPTMVAMRSIIDCARSSRSYVFIHICTFGLDAKNINMMKRMNGEFVSVSIHNFCIEKYTKKMCLISQTTHVTPSALIKFELPDYFKQLDYLLYLDSDVVVKNNFLDIFLEDVSNYYLAASFEFWKFLNDEKYTFSGWNHDFYFNSGLMLFNLEKMRDDSLTEKLWDYKLFSAKTKLMDQESFNAVCAGNVKPLSIKWNFNPFFFENSYLKLINSLYDENFISKEELLDKVCVIHYVGKSDKPWVYKNARLQKIWLDVFLKCFPNASLNLKEFNPIKTSVFSRTISVFKLFGFQGLLVSFVHRIKNENT